MVQSNHTPHPTGRPVPVQEQWVLWKVLLLSMTCELEYPFGQGGSAVLAASSPRILPTPSPALLPGGRVKNKQLLDAVTSCIQQ